MFPLRLNVTNERKFSLNISLMTQITSSLYIFSLKLPLLYENETFSHGPKNCQKIGLYDNKTCNC